MREIAPSILSADFAHLAESCLQVMSEHNRMLHFDVMDGVFVPNISVGLPVLASLKKAIPQAEYDVHLMIVEPKRYLDAFAKAGADVITFHIEAQTDAKAHIKHIQNLGCKAGLSLRPGTPMETIFPYVPFLDRVLVMSVEPGFGGQAFQPQALERIAQLKQEANKTNPGLEIEVDGGINLENAAACFEAGADILVAGNTVFSAKNPAEMAKALKEQQMSGE